MVLENAEAIWAFTDIKPKYQKRKFGLATSVSQVSRPLLNRGYFVPFWYGLGC